MINYKLLDYPNIDFQLFLDKGTHHADVPLHSHDFNEFTIITDGSATHEIEGVTYHISKGDVFVALPGFSHSCKSVDNLCHYNFMFDANKFVLFDKEIKSLYGFQSFFITAPEYKYQKKFISRLKLTDSQLQFAEALCEEMYREFSEKKNGFDIIIKAHFLSLIAYISRLYTSESSLDGNAFLNVEQTLVYIEEHFSERITLSEIAGQAFICERQYSRIFKKLYGTTPIQYIINCRLNNACDLIKNTGKSLTEIAVSCGFSDKSAFSKAFKARFGMPPIDYRNRHKI